MKQLADACVSGVGCHHFTGTQGTFIVIVIIIILAGGFLTWRKR